MYSAFVDWLHVKASGCLLRPTVVLWESGQKRSKGENDHRDQLILVLGQYRTGRCSNNTPSLYSNRGRNTGYCD